MGMDDYTDEELRDDWDFPYDEGFYDSDLIEDFYDEDPCERCGPHCKYWLGDNLCELEIERQVEVNEAFHEKFVCKVHCPICGAELLQASLPTDKLWVWPGGDWEFAGEFMLALQLFGTIHSAKGVLHQTEPGEDDDFIIYHCWRFDEDDQFLLKLRRAKVERA